jgi:hypothetical protein
MSIFGNIVSAIFGHGAGSAVASLNNLSPQLSVRAAAWRERQMPAQ